MKVKIPGYKELDLKYLVLDYNGTIAVDGGIPESVEELGADHCVCVGNGRNDMWMFRAAALSIAVMDEEGMYGKLAVEADICVRSIEEGMDLLQKGKRLIATLRG